MTKIVATKQFNGGQVGLAISQMLSIALLVQWGMFQSAEVTNQLTSVERILEYFEIPPETHFRDNRKSWKCSKIIGSIKNSPRPDLVTLQLSWPNKGDILFKNVSMRYGEHEEPVLRDMTFYIKASEKIGIVGRTGAGKSSLISAIFRLARLKGTIQIDGINIENIALEELRNSISIIPQNPVLFSGKLRNNLDPFDEFTDEVLWQSLEEVELKDFIVSFGCGLNYQILDQGSNFSVGQRQLICLARTILRNKKILILDEATANIDSQMDALIQKIIRKKFCSCTVLTVAHRLHTIIDSDKVMVIEKGILIEFDHPYILLKNVNSRFSALVKEFGDVMFKQNLKLTKKSYYYDKSSKQKIDTLNLDG